MLRSFPTNERIYIMATKKANTAQVTKKKPSAQTMALVAGGDGFAQTAVTKFALPEGFKVVKKVTLPAKSVKVGESGVFWILEPIHQSAIEGKMREGGVRDKPADICRAVDMETGEEVTLIVGVVITKNLNQHYPNDGYVNRVFGIENRGKVKQGDKYNSYNITEVAKES